MIHDDSMSWCLRMFKVTLQETTVFRRCFSGMI